MDYSDLKPRQCCSLSILLLLCLLFNACSAPTGTTPVSSGEDSLSTHDQVNQTEKTTSYPPILLDFDSTPVLKTAMVTSRSGAIFRQGCSEKAAPLGTYDYGTKLDIVEDAGDWWGVRERIGRTFVENDVEIERSAWEKVYVKKGETGSSSEIALSAADLYHYTYLELADKSKQNEQKKRLEDYLDLALIDKATFDQQKKESVRFFHADSTRFQQRSGTLWLPTTQGDGISLHDRITDGDDQVEYGYLGHIDILDAFVVSGSFYEMYRVFLFNRTTGEQMGAFDEFPHLSADKNYILTLAANPYETTGDLALYRVEGTSIQLLFTIGFTHWMPESGDRGFWGKDGNFYTPVNHKDVFWKENGMLNDHFQYLRIHPVR